MAKKPFKGRRMSDYLRGAVSEKMQLGALSPLTPIKQDFGDVVTEMHRATSIVARYSLDEFTPATNDGPILVGLAHSDYTVAEIEAWIENAASWETGDLVQAREIGRRLIKQIGIFPIPASELVSSVLNDGKAIRTKLNWNLATGQTIALWAYNMGDSVLATTDPAVQCWGHVNLFR